MPPRAVFRFVALLLAFALEAASAQVSTALPPFSTERMDPSVAPGVDFYRYANGTWEKTQSIPDDRPVWSPSAALMEVNEARLRELLEAASRADAARTSREAQLGDYYASVMDEARAEALKFQPIAGDLAKIEALDSIAMLPELLADFHERDIGGLFDVSVSPDARRSDTYVLELTQGGLTLPDRDYYFEKQFAREREAYHKHAQTMFGMLGVTEANPDAVIAIETALAKASRKLEQLTDPVANYHKLTLAELQKLTPSFDWARYFTAAHAASSDTVVVGQPEFFRALEPLLRSQPLAAWKSYLRWHVVVASAPLLHDAAVRESFAFFGTTLTGQPALEPRWKRAIRRVDASLGEALGQLYVERYFPPVARERMQEMIGQLKAVYHDRLAKVPWMTEPTRREALAKFARFSAKIGSPEKPRDYAAIEIRRDDLVGNEQRAAAFESRRQMARVRHPVDRSEWEMTAPTVNAYFHPAHNEIVFPAGILQPPFFDPQMDDAVNYGATGATIGHEMTHGFDSEGRKYDAAGNLRDWWTKRDTAEFDRRAAVLVKQFNALSPLPGSHVNGRLTLAENIADLGGLSIAYEALQRALAEDPSKRKSNDGFTPEQRFFLAYTQSWASLERPEQLRRSLTADTHAPDRFRAVIPLTNLPEFFEAFDIQKDAPLWRPKAARAVIW